MALHELQKLLTNKEAIVQRQETEKLQGFFKVKCNQGKVRVIQWSSIQFNCLNVCGDSADLGTHLFFIGNI